jgi:hypothetical protein
MLPFQNGTICCAGASFIRQNALCFTPFYHGSKPWALANIGRRDMDFIREPLFIAPNKTLVAWHALAAFLDLTGIVVGTKGNSCRLGRSLIFGVILWRSLNMRMWPSGAFNQSGVNNGGSGLFHLQPVALYLATDLGK